MKLLRKDNLNNKLHILRKLYESCEHDKAKDHIFNQFSTPFLSYFSYKFLESFTDENLFQFVYSLFQKLENEWKNNFSIDVGTNISYFPQAYKNHLFIQIFVKDTPFIIDSLQNYFFRKNFKIVQMIHPIFYIQGEDSIKNLDIDSSDSKRVASVNFILNVGNITNEVIDTIKKEIKDIFATLHRVVDDFSNIKECLTKISRIEPEETRVDNERRLFYAWMNDENAILLGSAFILGKKLDSAITWNCLEDKKGILAYAEETGDDTFVSEFTSYLDNFKKSTLSLNIAESNQKSKIHTLDNLLYVFGKEKAGEYEDCIFCFVMLFTYGSSLTDVLKIPMARFKLERILLRKNYLEGSFKFKEARDFLNKLPKYEVFRCERDEITHMINYTEFSWEITQSKVWIYTIKERNYARLTVAFPSENFSKKNFNTINKFIERAVGQTASIKYWFVHNKVAYSYFVFLSLPSLDKIEKFDRQKMADTIFSINSTWKTSIYEKLAAPGNEELSEIFQNLFQNSFNKFYQASHTAEQTLLDIEFFTQILNTGRDKIYFQQRTASSSFLIVYTEKNYSLSDLLPKLENLALKAITEISYDLTITDKTLYKKVFRIEHRNIPKDEYLQFSQNAAYCIAALIEGTLANNTINQLATLCYFSVDELNLLNAYRIYFHQLVLHNENFPITKIILQSSTLIRLIILYFKKKFAPQINSEDRKNVLTNIEAEIFTAINSLQTLAEDKIFRNLYNIFQATVRTNFYSRKDNEALACKIDCNQVNNMRTPKPLYEIVVYEKDMFGVHLRGGKIARGGIRYSDRPEDLRTEVLGLMTTQMSKNAVIVPEGAKGGFVIYKNFSNRKSMMEGVEKYYRHFIYALLSITDNIADSGVIHPENTVLYDQADPYFVVAADKGTAHLSDVANEISQQYNFWLGDGFASGGTVGYNHKDVGITARGAWECVKIHFLEDGIDIQNENFSVVGIGDMAGDVFGNGMLLSKKILLKGAFNHIHIFVDPNPKDEEAWQERKRLFETPGTNWKDFNKELISEGGGIFERSSKSIVVSPQMKLFLDIEQDTVSGEELIRLLLTSPVDLLWNGGIGTYVKSSQETQVEVLDPANNSVRVNASQLRARVIGEGGNLGFTALSRIEYAQRGGKINADSIDNSAGVDMSDHEVNIKILLQQLMEKNDITSAEERARLLAEFTDEVTESCLNNNRLQSHILSIDCARSQKNIQLFLDQMTFLSQQGILDREGSRIPTNKSLFTQKENGIPRPLMTTLLSYTKLHLYKEIEDGSFINFDEYRELYYLYFPKMLRDKYDLKKYQHQLFSQITATVIVNRYINQCGAAFLTQLHLLTGKSLVCCLYNYMIADIIFQAQHIRDAIYSLFPMKEIATCHSYLQKLEDFLNEMTLWLMLNHSGKIIEERYINQYENIVQSIDIFQQKFETQDAIKFFFDSIVEQENPLEIAQILTLKNVSNDQIAVEFSRQINEVFSLQLLQKTLINISFSSLEQKKHAGIILQQLYSAQKQLYEYLQRKLTDFLEHPKKYFNVDNTPYLAKFVTDKNFLSQNPQNTLHMIAIIVSELSQIQCK